MDDLLGIVRHCHACYSCLDDRKCRATLEFHDHRDDHDGFVVCTPEGTFLCDINEHLSIWRNDNDPINKPARFDF